MISPSICKLSIVNQEIIFDRNQFQANAFKLADVVMEIEVARIFLYKAWWLKDAGKSFTKEVAIAKLYVSEVMSRSVNHAVQLHRGYGFYERI
jgi:alkylation response protein AidB-like acyl-CoA dehydrogenase